MHERTALPGGPRVISAQLPGTRSLSVAVHVPAGARHEADAEAGIAHFLEHVTFRGTPGWPTSRAVAEAVEGAGGTSNAATDRESTVYWVRLPVRDAALAIRVLADLVVRPLLADDAIEREREIIVEEIRSYRDDPAQHVLTLADGAWFGAGPMGREIAGDEDGVRALTPAAIRAFWQRGYAPGGLVVAAAGDLPHARIVELVAEAFGTGPADPPRATPAAGPLPHRRVVTEARATAQAHLCIAYPGLPRDDPDQWVMELLVTILGDGSSSRLFLGVREDAGLAYDISAWQTDHADAGTISIYAGVAPSDLGRAIRAILAEVARLRDGGVPAAELAKAQRYLIGRLELRLEESRALAAWLGTQEALHDRVHTLDAAVAALSAVRADDIARLAGRLLGDDGLALTAIAPRTALRGIERHLRPA